MVELLAAAAVFGSITVALMLYTSTSARMVGRNLATNHSHENIRVASQRIMDTLHDAASPFVLVNFDGTNYSDATTSATADVDLYTSRNIGTRANGVRFYLLAGGPYKLTQTALPTTTDLRFDFSSGGQVPYQPIVGDRIVIPLISREFQITMVVTAPTPSAPTGVVRINDTNGVGFQLTVGTGNCTPAYFYRKSAFTVYQNQLRFHKTFEGAAKADFIVVRNDITSPKPFGLLYDSATAPSSDGRQLRMSLETTDGSYSNRAFGSSTTTLVGVVPQRTLPLQLNSTD